MSVGICFLLLCPGTPWAVDDPSVRAIHREACGWRVYYGLRHQRLDETCCVLAQRHAEYMAENEWFEHGKNDQIIYRGSGGAAACMSAWVYSGPHRAWLLSHNSRCGWGHAVSRNGTHYWAGVFRR